MDSAMSLMTSDEEPECVDDDRPTRQRTRSASKHNHRRNRESRKRQAKSVQTEEKDTTLNFCGRDPIVCLVLNGGQLPSSSKRPRELQGRAAKAEAKVGAHRLSSRKMETGSQKSDKGGRRDGDCSSSSESSYQSDKDGSEETEEDAESLTDDKDRLKVTCQRKRRSDPRPPRKRAKVGDTAVSTSSRRGAWEPAFRAGKTIREIDGVPSLEQAYNMEREARLKPLPPMTDLSDIFFDIVRRMPGILDLARTLQGRPLRVATVCSGTEAPLLALKLIARAIKEQHGITVEIHHVFSCEIEPYKQAYIERNFTPPILFRDVCELAADQAYTTYGALVDVPGHVDLLVAGTSCVDYSSLNRCKKDVNDGGESGRTFFGMLRWVELYEPALVLLENIKSAPWAQIGTFFEEIGYDAAWSNTFDTKNYYIPHTRQRGYLLATRNRTDSYAGNWEALTRSLARPASSMVDDFLLPTDDPRIHKARSQFARGEGLTKLRSTIDWSKCQGRHERARDQEALGNARPFTAWEEGGTCRLSHDAWNEWAIPQPERVLDLLDITHLRAAAKGFDPHYKSQVWELSQNVDRNITSSKTGTCMCLTPNGMPYLTCRGGPLIGLEALSLQGLPIDELLLTRESNDQLQNLAGNAMTSTVVGTCLLAALVLARPDLEKNKKKKIGIFESTAEDRRKDKETIVRSDGKAGTQLVGRPEERPYDLISGEGVSLDVLLREAEASSQHCTCEGYESMTKKSIYRCRSCQHTACETCKSRPEHDYILDNRERIDPVVFAQKLKQAIPMRIIIGSVSKHALQAEEQKSKSAIPFVWEAWVSRVVAVLHEGVELQFSQVLRQKHWSVRYHGSGARLECCLDPQEPQWRLFVEPDRDEVVGSPLRKVLLQPVARMFLRKGSTAQCLLEGHWELRLPFEEEVWTTCRMSGEKVPTWEASMGLQGAFAGQTRFSRMDIVAPDDIILEKLDISGTYDLLNRCATANGALHKRRHKQGKPLFFFLDPDKFGSVTDDCYVFSNDIDKPPYPLDRILIASMPSGWKPPLPHTMDVNKLEQPVNLTVKGEWTAWPQLSISVPRRLSALLGMVTGPPDRLSVCDKAMTVVTSACSLQQTECRIWPNDDGRWHEVDLQLQATKTFRSLAWLTERISLPEGFSDWIPVCSKQGEQCVRCAPVTPTIQWLLLKGRPAQPVENVDQAGPFERALKQRPSPFVVQLRYEQGIGRMRIGINPVTLAHRALALLPNGKGISSGDIQLSWRLTLTKTELNMFNLPDYTLLSNRNDLEAKDPSFFLLPLRKEQRRSLHWMLQQESDDVAPFQEEEVTEGMLEPLKWRIEGRAARQVKVRGGVLADAVGYGKTCIMLALIAATHDRSKETAKKSDRVDLIATQATLVIVPSHLCRQWGDEVDKFCGNRLKVIIIYSKATLNCMTVADILSADVVIMSVTVYKSDAYFDALSRLAAANKLPPKPGRYFDAVLQCTLKGLRNRIFELRTKGADVVLESVKDQVDFDPSQYSTHQASKRLVGRAYADAHDTASGLGTDAASNERLTVPVRFQAKKLENDIWDLKKRAARCDWRQVRAMPLEAFYWARVVIDEFHYVSEHADRAHSAIRELQAENTWILSGTPPTADFADVQSIASFLKIHLGVDDDQDSTKASVRQRRERMRTRAEQFRSFVDIRSAEWHHRRQAIGQAFLDRFVRQNVADIDEIPFEVVEMPIRMPAAERACYLELAHMIEALDLRLARRLFRVKVGTSSADSKKKLVADSSNDRDERLRRTVGESGSPEEALSRQASHFVLSDDIDHPLANAIDACEYIVRERQWQRDQCFEQFQHDLQMAIEQHFVVLLQRRFRDEKNQALVSFCSNAINGYWGDADCKPALVSTLLEVGAQETKLTLQEGKKRYPGWKQFRKDAEADWAEEHRLREMVHMLQRLRNEFWCREQSLRYFRQVRNIQQARTLSVEKATAALAIRCPSPKCDKAGRLLNIDEMALASTCGHTGCRDCLTREAYIGKCCTADCFSSVKPTSIVPASTLGHDSDKVTAYGIKLATVATIIKTHIPSDERILLFVQYDGLLKKVAEALQRYGVQHVRLRGSAVSRSNLLSDFQNGQQRVLLLNIADESAAGSNLTVANHVIFLSPLITEEAQSYHATMSQAKGRAVRFGQTRKVTIWRFFVRDTIDEHVYAEREGGRLADDDDVHAIDLIDVGSVSSTPIKVSKRKV